MLARIISSAVIIFIMVNLAAADPFEDGLAAYVQGDFAAALRLWRPLAEQGDAAAQHNLGVMYSQGQGLSQDYAEAVRWWLMAAEQGFADAQYSLGVMYEFGQGIPQDKVAAATWFRAAAEQEQPAAQHRLGLLYLNGLGVSQDFVMAYMWLNLAAAQGDTEAAKERDTLAKRMTPEQLAEAQRLAREWKQEPAQPAEPETGGEQAPDQKQQQEGADVSVVPKQSNVTVLIVNSAQDDGGYILDARPVKRVFRRYCCKDVQRFATGLQRHKQEDSWDGNEVKKQSYQSPSSQPANREWATSNAANDQPRPRWLPPIDPWYVRH